MTISKLFFGKNTKVTNRFAEEIELLHNSPLLDSVWYRQTYWDVRYTPVDVAKHYLEYGAAEGRNPGPLFDTKFYLKQNRDVVESGLNPLVHYILYGQKEGRDPLPRRYDSFPPEQTRNTVKSNSLPPQDSENGISLAERRPNGMRNLEPGMDITASRSNSVQVTPEQQSAESPDNSTRPPAETAITSLFDPAWYLSEYPDLEVAGVDPFQHFIQFGWREMRDPNAMFDVDWYLENNPDVRKADVNPLEHYIAHGWKEQRDPSANFSVEYYLERNQDVRDAGLEPLAHYLRFGQAEGRLIRRSAKTSYASYVDATRWNLRSEIELRTALAALSDRLPKISVLMPVYETEASLLKLAIESIRSQAYENFELCISDDASKSRSVREILDFYAALDHRILVNYRSENGHISRNTNDAFSLSSGDVIVLLDADDELAWDALAEIAIAFARSPAVDFVYSDCDKINEKGTRYDPHFKPDWSPELLLTYMYAGQCLAVRRRIWTELGGLRVGYEGSQDHDFALRATELARQVGHIPRVLYHWRSHSGSTAQGGGQKPYSFEAARRAIDDALTRKGITASAARPSFAVKGGMSFFELKFPNYGPKVSIIIPTYKNVTMLQKCINSLKLTEYKNYEIVIVADDVTRKDLEATLMSLGAPILWAPRSPSGFNFAQKVNWASRRVDGEFIVLLNDDTEILNPGWLSSMVGYARCPGVGVVGALLRFPDGRVQHAGIISGMQGGRCGIAFRLSQPNDRGYCSLISAARNCSAVTAACLLVSRKLYYDLGGFDEAKFAVAYNDPDFCYRAMDAGYRIVYTPQAELTHYEGASRGFVDNPEELAAYLARYSERPDPYFNPNFSDADERFRVKPTNVTTFHTDRKPCVAFVSHNLNWEGAPRHLANLASSLKSRANINPIVFSLSPGPLTEFCEAAGIPVVTLPSPPGWKCEDSEYISWSKKIQDEFTKYRVWAVFANTLECFFAVGAAAALGIPALWNIHESEGELYFANWSSDVSRAAARCFEHAYRLIFVSDATASIYSNLDKHNVSITIKNGYSPPSGPICTRSEARRRLSIEPNEIVFLSVGTVCERKAQLDLISALALIDVASSSDSKFTVIICGDREGPYSDKLHLAFKELPPSMREHVRIVAETGEVSVYFAAADTFICTSRLESYPSVIMEAMGAGLGIITTGVFGIAEQVSENGNALMFEPGDYQTLASHIRRVLLDEELRLSLGQFSTKQLQTLPSKTTMINQYERNILQACTATAFRN